MCELFCIKKTDDSNIQKSTLRNMLEIAEKSSESNPDGFGVFNEKGKIYKSGEKFSDEHIEKIVRLFQNSSHIVFHLRMATHGNVKTENSHPFKNGEYIMSHNGVIRNVSSESGDVDSEQFLNKLVDVQGSTVEKVKESVKHCNGRFSNFLQDRDGNLYYWRDGSSMTFGLHKGENLFMGFTNKRRFQAFCYSNFKDYHYTKQDSVMSITPKSETLFRIDNKHLRERNSVKIEAENLEIGSEVSYSTSRHSMYAGWGYTHAKNGYRVYKKNTEDTEERNKTWDDWVTETYNGFSCDKCLRYFKSRNAVYQHVRDKHGVELEYKKAEKV